MSLTFLDFFAGVGGFRRGLELAGFKCIGYCESVTVKRISLHENLMKQCMTRKPNYKKSQ